MRHMENNAPNAFVADSAALSDASRQDMAKSEHFVQFYEDDNYLVESIARFVGAALGSGGAAVVIATPAHRLALQACMHSHGLDVAAFEARRQYVQLDAAETLARFMVNSAPDPVLFKETISPLFAGFKQDGRAISAFGEMVALLWAEGNGAAAIRLEELWNELAASFAFSLFCAYPIGGFQGQTDGQPFTHICDKHTRVIPAESYTTETQLDERLRSISSLQQKAVASGAETKERERAEALLREQQTRLTVATNLANLAIWDINLETYAIEASDEFKGWLGVPADQPLDYQSLLQLMHPNDRRRVSYALHTAVANNLDYDVEYRLLNKQGVERWLKVMGRYFRDAWGQRMLCVACDISESKRAEQSNKPASASGSALTH